MNKFYEEYNSEEDDGDLLMERGLRTPPPGRFSDIDTDTSPQPAKPKYKLVLQKDRMHYGPSLDVESLSSIQSQGEGERGVPPDVKEIYQELQEINKKLKDEFRVLHERELMQREKERAVAEAEENISRLAEEEVQRRWNALQEEHDKELLRAEMALREKARENKRLKDNFDTLKAANETLKQELEALQAQHNKLEKQSAALQARLTNLQRKQEYSQRKEQVGAVVPSARNRKADKADTSRDSSKGVTKRPKPTSANTFEVVAVLFEWLSDVHLRFMVSDQPTKPIESLSSPEFVQDKCIKILPSLVDMLKEMPSNNFSIVLPSLQFIYWALVHVDQTEPKTSLSSTMRRLGEELYRPRPGKAATEPDSLAQAGTDDSRREGIYFHSNVLHIRFVSSLIILKTVTQVDHLAHVFEVLKNDLKTETAKELFVHYQATPVFLPFLRPTSKLHMASVVDVYLTMCMDSPVLQLFLETCSCEPWFRITSLAFRMPNQHPKVIEKLSIILQKLSKIKSNKRYFEVFGITTTCQEMMRTQQTETFLLLNIKSILFNLGALRPGSSSTDKT